MKKLILNFTAIVFVTIMLAGCGSNANSIESDAKEYAALMCKAQRLISEGASKVAAGDMSIIAESNKMSSDAAALASKMQGKYNDAEDYQKFNSAYLKAMAACQ